MLSALIFLLLSSTVSSAPLPSSNTASFDWNKINYVYAFGDSYSFIPGTFGESGFRQVFKTFHRFSFTPRQLYTDEIIPNRSSSGGSNWLQYLTECFVGLPAECPRQIWGFAHGGSDIDGALLPTAHDTGLQMSDQVRQWLEYGSYVLPKPAGQTLTTWWAGINDCTHMLNNETITDHDAFLDKTMESYFRLVSVAARNGLKTHLFLTVPPVDRSQFAETVRGGPQAYKEAINLFNDKLVARVAKYTKDNPEQTILSFNAAAFFTNILDHPQQFGFNDTKDFCSDCEDQEAFFWHNVEHPTDHVHRLLAKAIEGPFIAMNCILAILYPILCTLLASLAVNARRFSWNNIKYVYAFGDSYSFVQGTKGHANFSFIGDNLSPEFTPQDLLTNQIIPRNVSKFLTKKKEVAEWGRQALRAQIGLPLHHDFTIPLVDQVAQWVTYGSTVIPHPQDQTLTTWWIGINDTGDSNRNASIANFTTFWETEMRSYFKAVDLASSHGLNTHLFLNVPPEERSPGSLGDPGQLKDHINLFNSVLENHITQFANSHPGKCSPKPLSLPQYIQDDVIINATDAPCFLDNPAEFGFSDVTGFCTCADPAGYFWYTEMHTLIIPSRRALDELILDTGHPTQRVHQLLAEAVKDQLLSVGD
ncbi:hypothetical protein NP233_g7254 [Leucocoprinus birnbaumii]|uniref:Carbohydrate esterase family 16 protein n=1 Tax=Leucocoprinus birnbaumii TaxID=56174 RepID=A0AAD5YP97_9AGAR|nr:hypothetical protein NP233_g7254 [Leucocoprinus birnbaumii]